MYFQAFQFGLSAFLASFLALASVAQTPANPLSSAQTWITNVTILSPENPDHTTTGAVVIENGRILRMEQTNSPKPPAGATVISGKGQYLIPGLIDSHVHLASVPGMNTDLAALSK